MGMTTHRLSVTLLSERMAPSGLLRTAVQGTHARAPVGRRASASASASCFSATCLVVCHESYLVPYYTQPCCPPRQRAVRAPAQPYGGVALHHAAARARTRGATGGRRRRVGTTWHHRHVAAVDGPDPAACAAIWPVVCCRTSLYGFRTAPTPCQSAGDWTAHFWVW